MGEMGKTQHALENQASVIRHFEKRKGDFYTVDAAFLAGDGGQHQTTDAFLGNWAKGIPTLVVHLQMVPRRAQHSSAPSYIPRSRMKIQLVSAK